MNTRWHFIRLLACALVCTAWAGTAQAGLIVNGDFESFSPFFASPGSPITSGGWTFENSAGVDTGFLGNPGRAVRLESNGLATSDPTISQTVTGLSVGTTYTLSWDLALRVNFSGSGTGRSFGVFLDSQTLANNLFFDEHLSATYESQSVDFVATSSTHTFIFAGELDSRTNGLSGKTDVSYRIDNIDLNPAASSVPEPSSIALWGMAAFAAAAMRTRGARSRSQSYGRRSSELSSESKSAGR